MTIRSINHRPQTFFDVNNKSHRQSYYDFMTNHSWKNCPYSFIIEEPYKDLPTMIHDKLLSYYLTKEFGVVKKQRPSPSGRLLKII
jgi:hypothetical protein